MTTDRGEATGTRVDITIEANELATLGDALAAAAGDVRACLCRVSCRQCAALNDAAQAWRAARGG